LGEDGQTSGIIEHAGQLPCTLLELLNISLPFKPTLNVLFYLPICWAIIIAAAASQLVPYLSTG